MNKIKLQELLDSTGALQQLMAMNVEADLAFRLSDCWHQIRPALDNYRDRLADLRKKYKVEKDTLLEDAPAGFRKEHEKLTEIEVPLQITPIPRSALNGLKVQPRIVINTSYLWEQPESESDDDGDDGADGKAGAE